MVWIIRRVPDRVRRPLITGAPSEPRWRALTESHARGGTGRGQRAGRMLRGQTALPLAAGGERGAHATAKGTALSQFIIFMRQQHPSHPPLPANLAEGGAWGGEPRAARWDRGQWRSPRGGMKQGMNGVLGENGNSQPAPRLVLLRGVPCSR